MPGHDTLLRARDISWWIGGCQILHPLSLDVGAGECVAVVGPNGAGKTTLLRLLAGLLAPASGDLSWMGTPFARMSRRDLARRIAYVPQVRPARIPLTVEQMVLLGRYPYMSPLQMAPGARDFERVAEVLASGGLTELRHRQLDGLSGGERQSVFIAAALAQEADALLLDEPTTHLDPRHQLDIAELLVRLRAHGNHAIVITTHDLNLAARLADRVVALRQGEIVSAGTPQEMMRPERLAEVFDAPFESVGKPGHPRVLLRLER